MKRTKNTTRESGSRFVSQTAIYKAKRCKDCPLRCLCHESKDNREIEVNHVLREYRQKARERLVSEEELRMLSKRAIGPEAMFGQMKFNKSYNRYRHVGKDKIEMVFAIFAIAFNILKLQKKATKKRKTAKTRSKILKYSFLISFLAIPNKRSKSQQAKSKA